MSYTSNDIKAAGEGGCCGVKRVLCSTQVTATSIIITKQGKQPEHFPLKEISEIKITKSGFTFDHNGINNTFFCRQQARSALMMAVNSAKVKMAEEEQKKQESHTTKVDESKSKGILKPNANPNPEGEPLADPKSAQDQEEEDEEEEEETFIVELEELLNVSTAMKADLGVAGKKLLIAKNNGEDCRTAIADIKIILAGSEHLCADLDEIVQKSEVFLKNKKAEDYKSLGELLKNADQEIATMKEIQGNPNKYLGCNLAEIEASQAEKEEQSSGTTAGSGLVRSLTLTLGSDEKPAVIMPVEGAVTTMITPGKSPRSLKRKDGELDDITPYLPDDLADLDPNVRTIVHGFENKVRPGEIGRVLKPKNQRNWMLLEIFGREAHWVPSWVTSKGYFQVQYRHENVCKPGDIVEYLKGPLDGWLLLRNVTKRSCHAEWAPVDCLPDEAFETKPKSVQKADTFAAFHAYEERDKQGNPVEGHKICKGDELQFLSGPVNGWIQVRFLSTKQSMYAPYWILPHGLRPTDDAGHIAKQKRSHRHAFGGESPHASPRANPKNPNDTLGGRFSPGAIIHGQTSIPETLGSGIQETQNSYGYGLAIGSMTGTMPQSNTSGKNSATMSPRGYNSCETPRGNEPI